MQLTVEGCRKRQARLLSRMEQLELAYVIVNDPKHVLYLTGYSTAETQSSAAVLDRKGHCILISAPLAGSIASDEHVSYQPSTLATIRPDQPLQVAECVGTLVGRPSGLVGIDKSGANAYIAELFGESVDVSQDLARFRRRKDPDELKLLLKGIAVTHACYARARQIIAPGVSELDIYAELYGTAVRTAGERIPTLGNDFQCGTPGGSPRQRKTEEGEVYILDLGCEIGGYYADNCRAFTVNGEPSKLQLSAWQRIVDVFTFVESTVRPGVSCRELYSAVKRMLDTDWPGSFFHHLGHGVGLAPHEQPYLNPHWDQVFEEGDYFTVEPGLYSERLRGGIRLEENYQVTSGGVSKLTSFPLDL